MFRSLLFATLACAWAIPAAATSFNVIDDDSSVLLGTFDAPASGGPVTAGSFSLDGGVFDVLGTGNEAPNYDSINNSVTGTPGGFGGFSNSVAFNTVDFLNNAISCGVGECVFSMTSSGGSPVPAEWYLNYLPGGGGGSPISLGYYRVETAAIPLPATAVMMMSGLIALGFGRTTRNTKRSS